MVRPHGAEELRPLFVATPERRSRLLAQANGLPSIQVSPGAAAAAVMMGSGYLTPLGGFMGRGEALQVAAAMTLADGLFWPVPMLNLVREPVLPASIRPGSRVALLDPGVDGNPVLAIQQVAAIEQLTPEDQAAIAARVFGTTAPEHPGVAAFMTAGNMALSGPIQVLGHSCYRSEFADVFRSAMEVRAEIERRGWQTVAVYPAAVSLGHEEAEACRRARQATQADGVVVQVALGGSAPAGGATAAQATAVREAVSASDGLGDALAFCAGYPGGPLSAGQRQLLLQAICAQNSGGTHLMVGDASTRRSDEPGPVALAALPAGAMEIALFRG